MVRSFSGRPLPPGVLDSVLGSARRAPTAGNSDGWDVVVLEGTVQTASFWEATTTLDWRRRSRRWPGLSRAPAVLCFFAHPGAYVDRYSEPDKRAAGLGTVAGRPRRKGPPQMDPAKAGAPEDAPAEAGPQGGGIEAWPVPFWFVDAGFAVLLVLLAVADAGLGACFLGNFRGETELRRRLGVPPDRRYVGAVIMGEPGGDDPRSASLSRRRRNDREVFHRGRW